MSEADWQRLVVDLLHVHRWRVAHFKAVPVTVRGVTRTFTPATEDGKGFPDLVAVHVDHGAILFAELKTRTGRVKPEQREWLTDVSMAAVIGESAGVWSLLLRPQHEAWLRRFVANPHGSGPIT
jgi:hypothetical protein